MAQLPDASLQSFLEEFVENTQNALTQKAYLSDLRDFLIYLENHQNNLPWYEIKGPHLQHYRDYLTRHQFCPTTIHRKFSLLRSLYAHGSASGLCPFNPVGAVKLPRAQVQHPTRDLTDEEARHLLAHCDDEKSWKAIRDQTIIHFLLYLGLRRFELTQIQLGDIEKQQHQFILKIRGKGNKLRVMPIANKLQSQLITYLQHLENKGIALESTDYLFFSEKKLPQIVPLNPAMIYKMVAKKCQMLGFDKIIGPHSLRATCIGHLLETQQCPIRDVADFAGHKLTLTTEIYDKRRGKLSRSPANKINF